MRSGAFHLPDDPEIGVLDLPGVEKFAGDITDLDSVAQAARGVDVIFHCAAIVSDWAPESLFQKVMVGGAENVCKAALEAGVARLVDISTNDVFGMDETIVMDETLPLAPWGSLIPITKSRPRKRSGNIIGSTACLQPWSTPAGFTARGTRPSSSLWRTPFSTGKCCSGERTPWSGPPILKIWWIFSCSLPRMKEPWETGIWSMTESPTRCGISVKKSPLALNAKAPALRIPYPAAYAAAVIMERVWKILKKEDRPLCDHLHGEESGVPFALFH